MHICTKGGETNKFLFRKVKQKKLYVLYVKEKNYMELPGVNHLENTRNQIWGLSERFTICYTLCIIVVMNQVGFAVYVSSGRQMFGWEMGRYFNRHVAILFTNSVIVSLTQWRKRHSNDRKIRYSYSFWQLSSCFNGRERESLVSIENKKQQHLLQFLIMWKCCQQGCSSK